MNQEPTYTKDHGPVSDERVSHPAFANIQASRITGHAALYGSDFRHQHFIAIRIGESRISRNLSEDRYYGHSKEYIEVYLSEAQWATFVSSMNTTGVPCTLHHLKGEVIPQLPEPIKRHEKFREEHGEAVERGLRSLESLRKDVEELKVSQKQKDLLLGRINNVLGAIGNSREFMADQFSEHMEQTVERAKMEVNAYAAASMNNLALRALAAKEEALESPVTLEVSE